MQEMSPVSMRALGVAALALVAGVWALAARPSKKGGERQEVAPSVDIPVGDALSEDGEEDDLWEHIASILESRRRGRGHTQSTLEDDAEVWRIIEQILAARKHSHPHFQSPDRASTLSVKELRRWFESQAAQSSSSNEQSKSRRSIGGHVLAQSVNGHPGEKRVNGHEEEDSSRGREVVQEISFSDGGLSEEDSDWALAKIAALQGSDHNGPGSPASVTEKAAPSSIGAGELETVKQASGLPEPVQEVEKIPAPLATLAKVNKIVRRAKSPPTGFDFDHIVDDAAVVKSNGRAEQSKEGGVEKPDERGSQGAPLSESKSVSGGSDYQGPPGGEDRVVVYMTSVRAVRKTFEECATVRQIFHGFSVAVDERDLSIHLPYRQELKDLMEGRLVSVPQVFIRGKHVGGLHEVRYLADEKKMQELLSGMPRIKVTEECEGCGGGKFLPCVDCRGSRKIVVGDKVEACTACNEYGLIRCPMCA